MPGAGLMVPVRHAVARGGAGGGFSSTSTLTLSQPNLIEEQQQQQLFQHQIDQNGQSNEDFDSKSCSENIEPTSGDELENPRPKKKRYHRHTQHQIQELESFFKECPHPDDKQRKELSRDLGLEPLQVKFWFQNKRTQMKNHHERQENTQLRTENEKLRAENMRYKEALGAASCPTCGGPSALGEMSFDEHHLRMENSRLREEIDRISGMAAKYVGKPIAPMAPLAPHQLHRPSLNLGVGNVGSLQAGAIANELLGTGDLLRSIQNHTSTVKKPLVIELAVAAMEEFVQMAQLGKPLWLSGIDSGSDLLNEEEYLRTFPRGIGPRPCGLKSEASREVSLVIMNHVHLVEMLMDVNQWSNVFSGIVSRASTVDVLSTGVAGSYNGALQVMSAEFQVPTPLIPTRESDFVRYCKQHADGMWAVVDVSLDSLNPNNVIRTRRRPSGCLIQEMPNGYSKVTWVEHVEVDDSAVHNMYKPVVNSGLAFGAKRWLATLERQCERLASVMASNIIPPGEAGVVTTQQGRKSMLKLAERMVLSFSNGVSASTSHQWTALSGSGADDVRVMTRKSVDDPGRPPGIVLSAATSFWIPVPPKRVFDFLRNENSRSEWDILSNRSVVQEMAHIANGREQGNCVSLLRVNSANSNQSNMLILQESCTDATGSFVIYAPVDIGAMDMVLNGGDPDYVALLPSGFSILPDGPPSPLGTKNGIGVIGDVGTGGSLLTVAFQILVDSVPTAKLSLGSVATVNNLISCTVERIKAAVSAADATQ